MTPGRAVGLGLALAGASAAVLAMLPRRARPLAAAQVTTLVATGSYLVPALRPGRPPARLVREVAAAAVGTAGAHLAAARAPRALGPLLAAHGVYDLVVERVDPEVLPTAWYAPFCAAYDVALGAALVPLLDRSD